MQKQKKGFWLFIFSLIPGAGEMYMGFKKQGISTMLLFWSIFALGASIGMDWLILFFPIVWFYSFFNVHNLKSLSEEEFYSIEDSYILHLDSIVGDTNTLIKKYRTVIAVLLIVFGVSILWRNLANTLYVILPQRINVLLQNFSYRFPQFVIAIAIILAGIYILNDKKHKSKDTKEKTVEEEHFWQPYRPYQQAENAGNTKPTATVIKTTADVNVNKTTETMKSGKTNTIKETTETNATADTNTDINASSQINETVSANETNELNK